jgi:hypothetical protein
MQPTPTYPAPGAPDGQPPWWGYPPAPWGTSPTPPWPAGPWWVPPPAPRRPRSRTRIAAIVAAGVVAVALLAAVTSAAIALGRAAGASMTTDTALPAVPMSPPVPATGLGDDPGLDGYAQRCHDGLFSACDDLYELSPPMSDYEQYGMTCGGRVKPFDVYYCTDLQSD